MPDEVNVWLVGGEVVKRNLKDILTQIIEGAKKAIKEGSFKIETDAKQIVPVKTGHLKTHISTEFNDEKESFSAKIGVQGIKHPKSGVRADHYGVFVEFGTRKMAARPYLYPSYLKNEQWIIDRIKKNTQPR